MKQTSPRSELERDSSQSAHSPGRERVAITGVGMVTALGFGARPSFARLCAGERGIRELEGFALPGLRSKFAAQVPSFDAPESYPRSDALAWLAAKEALAEAGFGVGELPRMGLSVGGTTGSLLETEAELKQANGLARAQRFLTHPLSCTVQSLARLLGPFAVGATSCSACSSGALAIVRGAQWVASGRTTLALVGGTDALCHMTLAGFGALGVVDPNPCRPFDVKRAGLSLGEGAGFMVLEAESNARARGAKILGWLAGFAVGAEAHHVTHPEPSGRRAAELMLSALGRAGFSAADVGYINAHGTGTQANDAMETRALEHAFGPELQRIWVSSSKGQLGHTLGAAGAIEAVISLLALEAARVPPSAGLEHAEHPELRFVRERAADCAPGVVLSNSFGFGGLDAVLCLSSDPPSNGIERAGGGEWLVRRSAWVPQSAAPGSNDALHAGAWLERARVLPDATDPFEGLDPERSRRFDRSAAALTRAAEQLGASRSAAEVARGLESEGVLARSGPEGSARGVLGRGLVVGAAYGNVERSLRFLDRLHAAGPKAVAPAEFPQLVPSASAGSVSTYMGLTGPVFSVCDGIKSASLAVESALAMLELGLCSSLWCGAAATRDAVVRELFPSVCPALQLAEGELSVLVELARRTPETEPGALARVVGHGACAGRHDADAIEPWAPPKPTWPAHLFIADLDGSLGELVARSAWARVSQEDLLAGGFRETLGIHALALAAQAISREPSQALILCGDRESAYWVRLEPL
ncbi:MAG TPA: beta-ketoacyl-[acyl-carrier-protein] synthase family protein [Polyangiaceae bacterium]|nr:beta-ketoacyl-[acyl-carrier-protein] synthase family protein [Polyangiaceae bacterium]